MSFASFWSNLLATIVGGVLGGLVLALVFFAAKERWFPPPSVVGRWYAELVTEKTAFRPYEDMTLQYVLVLWREGMKVNGTAEKVFERSKSGEREYIGENRTRATVSGFIEKKYLGRDRIYLHVVEEGRQRQSTHFYDLTVEHPGLLTGTFISTVSDQEGHATCQREPY